MNGYLNVSKVLKKLDGSGFYSIALPMVKRFQVDLIAALDQRFFVPRYFDLKRALIFECQTVLTSGLKNLVKLPNVTAEVYKSQPARSIQAVKRSKEIISSLIAAQEVVKIATKVKSKIESKVVALAVEVLIKHGNTNTSASMETIVDADVDAGCDCGDFPEGESADAAESVFSIVQNEFDLYMSTPVTKERQKGLLLFWSSKRKFT